MTVNKSVLTMPRVNANDQTARLVRWVRSAGDQVRRGELVAQIETTKAAVDIEADADGFLQPLAEAGAMIAVGLPIAWIVDSYDPHLVAQEQGPHPSGRAGRARLISRKARTLMDANGLREADIPGDGPVDERQVLRLIGRDGGAAPELAETLPISGPAVALYGAADQGTVVLDALRAAGAFSPLCFIDDEPETDRRDGLPVFQPDVLQTLVRRGVRQAHICIGAPAPKLRVAAALGEMGFTIISVIHPRSVVSPSAQLGVGIYIGPGVVIGPDAVVGDYCQINNNATIPHHVKLGTGVRISDGANLAGGIVVGDRSYLGLGVTVNTGCNIGRDVTIVSGVSIFDSVADGTTVRSRSIRR